ncbi:trigger factor [Lacticaseibacillus pantheris DSM 15945 = JCM 12539 = NBRC 106106]|uniref:Trigger factor n=1 Tax=Lacticaseibacillus pantheris DSM 15945 = JCM 12539 = NBRC 106106 TaxID=1423783 RepID=A0A0R1TW28_9LACO|nr:trigger factor [Lacticaseibacillus pantheris]KRL85545.1 trigger factor [Lacticaseibacillus pantheris DSM 15945 = JCM 12539 = NBRC 106106]
MTAEWTKQGAVTGELTFDIAQDEIKQGLDKAFVKVRKSLTVPGFRKGKVPRVIFDQMYGEGALYEDALNILLPDAYEHAVDEAGIDPVDQPELSVESMDEGKPWSIKATVTVKPDVKLGDYKGISVPKQNKRVYVADVNKELDKKREQQAELVVTEDAAKEGDTVVIDYVGTVDGKEFDGGSAKNHSLELGSGAFIPGFEDQLVGHKTGDEVTVKVTFPKEYQASDLAGKDAEFAVTVHEVKVKEMPELDDDFAKDVDDSVETLDELKDKIKADLKKQKEDAAESAIEEAAIKGAVDNATVEEIPDAMVKSDIDNQMQQFLGNMQRQGINPDMYYQLTGTSEADLRKQFNQDAETRVKTNLVLEAIVDAEGIKATEDEIDAEVADLANDYGMEKDAVRRALTDDMLTHDIAVKKAIKVITDNAVEEKAAKKDDDSNDDQTDSAK